MPDLPWLRRERRDRNRGWPVSAAARPARSGGQPFDGWRIVLLHPERHTEYRDARLAAAGSRYLATRRLHPESAEVASVLAQSKPIAPRPTLTRETLGPSHLQTPLSTHLAPRSPLHDPLLHT